MVQADVRVIPNPSLVGAQHVVVLHAISLEQIVMPIVHQHREVHHDLVLGLRQHELLVMGKPHQLRRDEHLLDRLMKQVLRITDDLELFEHR